MKSMQKIAFGQDIVLAQNALLRQEYLWVEDKLVLRGEAEGKIQNWATLDALPQFRPFIFGLMARMEGEELRDVWLARGEEINIPQQDTVSTFIIPILMDAQGVMTVADEAAGLLPGDVWWMGGAGGKIQSQSSMVVLVVTMIQNSPALYVPNA